MSVLALPRPAEPVRRRALWLSRLVRRRATVVGLVLLAVTTLVGVLAPVIAGDPLRMEVSARLTAPGAAHWFGTDDVGRDVWSRVVYGARLSLLVGAAVVLLAFAVGLVCGLPAGYWLPNCLSPVIVQASFVFAAAVLTEAALSFLGVGVPPYVPSWGNILAEGRLYLQQAPWLVLYPGAAIMLTIFGLNLLGDGLRDLLDPRLRGLVRERS